jgi:tetrahydromethanopterin S-methyltransferase subunit E
MSKALKWGLCFGLAIVFSAIGIAMLPTKAILLGKIVITFSLILLALLTFYLLKGWLEK